MNNCEIDDRDGQPGNVAIYQLQLKLRSEQDLKSSRLAMPNAKSTYSCSIQRVGEWLAHLAAPK